VAPGSAEAKVDWSRLYIPLEVQTMKLQNRWQSLVALIMVVCLLALPVSALGGKKGKDHFDRGMKLENAQQWEKAAQEFTLAIAADPHNVDYQLHYRRAVFNASQSFMQQGRALAEQRDYVGAYNAFRQAFGYDPVNQLAVSEMERMLRLQEVKEGRPPSAAGSDTGASSGTGATPPSSSTTRPQEALPPPKPEQVRVITYNGDLKPFIRTLADDLKLNVMFDKQTFAQPRPIDINLHDVTTAKALDYIFLQEGLFFQKLDRRTILVADQGRRQQFQQLVVRTFYLSNTDPDSASALIGRALPASVGRPQAIVVPDKYTNSLTVRDTAENIALIGDLLRSIDKDRAEVVMDVNIYEVSRTDLLTFGNQLGDDTSLVNLGGMRSQAGTIGGLARVITGTGATAVGLPSSFGAALVFPASSLQALQTKNRTRLLAATQVHAFNNEESTARIGQRVPVQTAQAFPFGVQTGTTTGTANQPFGSGGFPVINYEPTGLTLSFTPQVFPNLDVQVKMKIKSNDVSGASTLTPTFTEREITGTARVQNNRTMMLASVTTDIQSNGRKGLPILGLVPVLGRLFTSPTRDDRQVDIVIAVTPRVLRAPAVTPRDEEMRQSGTLQSPTTGSIAMLLQEAERDEQIAAARQIPKEVAVQIPDAPPTYVPATKAAEQTANSASIQSAPQVTAASQNDSTTPAPKAAALTASTEQPKTLDVASAIKNIVSPGTGVSASSASAKPDVPTALVVEQLSPKSEAPVKTNDASVTELRLVSEKGELRVGEKQQLTVQLKSDAPLGMAVLTMRFDPNVIKIKSVSAGGIFLNAKVAPTITQSIDAHGLMLVSLAPAAGSAVNGEGGLLNFEVEAIGVGDSALAFDLANVHLVASDGRYVTLQIEPIKLTVRQ
jgi:general secretion pathway protein D